MKNTTLVGLTIVLVLGVFSYFQYKAIKNTTPKSASVSSVTNDPGINKLAYEACRYGALKTAWFYVQRYKVESPDDNFSEDLCGSLLEVK